MILLIKYWQPIASAVLSLIVAYNVHNIVLNYRLSSQEVDLLAECKQSQSISYEVSNAYQGKLSDLNDRMRKFDGVRHCIPVAPAPGRCDDAAKGHGHVGPNGIDPKTLFVFAFDAERYRLQLIACQDFIRRATNE